jgi:hypothetical protein
VIDEQGAARGTRASWLARGDQSVENALDVLGGGSQLRQSGLEIQQEAPDLLVRRERIGS